MCRWMESWMRTGPGAFREFRFQLLVSIRNIGWDKIGQEYRRMELRKSNNRKKVDKSPKSRFGLRDIH